MSPGQIKLDNQDEDGKSVIHFVVNPLSYGSFENAALLKDMLNVGFDATLKDKSGNNPYFYAC